MKNQKTCRKGQGAMEYLMTYGWAILVLTIALLVMWQLGIFKLSSSTGSGSSGFGAVNLPGISYRSTGVIECVLTNDAGGDITITGITAKVYGTPCSNSSLSSQLNSGASEKFTITNCPKGSLGDAYKIILVIRFTDTATNINHTSAGNVWGSYDK